MTDFDQLFGPSAPSEASEFVFHYTSVASACAIAATREFKFNPMRAMNDPREFRPAGPPTMGPLLSGENRARVDAALHVLEALRLNLRVAAFTSDRACGQPGGLLRSDQRGYARPTLWSHYALRHKGVCLAFDRAALEAQLLSLFPDHVECRHIKYPEQLDRTAWSPPLPTTPEILSLDGGPLQDYLGSYLKGNSDQYLFTKNRDWEGEREWRCCIYDETGSDAIFVPLPDGVVVGIVVGLDIPESDLRLVRSIAETFHIDNTIGKAYLHGTNAIDVRRP